MLWKGLRAQDTHSSKGVAFRGEKVRCHGAYLRTHPAWRQRIAAQKFRSPLAIELQAIHASRCQCTQLSSSGSIFWRDSSICILVTHLQPCHCSQD